jgi:hypothetical protein
MSLASWHLREKNNTNLKWFVVVSPREEIKRKFLVFSLSFSSMLCKIRVISLSQLPTTISEIVFFFN